jgi:SAM-dependent methyltransferase
MQYEPVKNILGKIFSRSTVLRRAFYFLVDLLLLRTWHVRKKLNKIAADFPGRAVILDAGCGLGQYSWRMSRMNRNWEIRGADINEGQIEECREFFGKMGLGDRTDFRVLDLTALDETSIYDLILSVDVMEHIGDDARVFGNFFNALKKGGYLLISTPSDMGGSDVHGEDEHSFIDEHVRDGYGMDDIRGKLQDAGFCDIEIKYTYGKPGSISWRLSMKYPIMMLNASYLFFIILPFYYIIFFPVSVILNIFDVNMIHRTGTGLLVTARKK